jgi:hypothetical protein
MRMEKDRKDFKHSEPDPGDIFPDSDPDLEDLKELNVEPFTESDIFLDKKKSTEKPS